MELLKTYAIDAPTKCDYEYGSTFEIDETAAIPLKVMLFNTPFQDQWQTPACSCFCSAHITTELDRIDEQNFYDGFDLWKKALERGASPDWGWTNKAALDMLRELKIIGWYTIAKSLDEVLIALANGNWIFWGTNKCSWSKTWETWVFSYTENGAWHFFAILGYDMDEQILWAKNSWGSDWWPFGWKFKIPFAQLTNLFTRYVVSDNKTKQIFINKKAMEDAKLLEEAKTLWIWNGLEWKRQPTREEIVLIVMRALKNYKD